MLESRIEPVAIRTGLGSNAMAMRRFWAICGICLILVLSLTFFSGAATAQDSSKNADRNISQKEGLEALADGGGIVSDGPTRFQMGLGFGSCIVAFIAWKWL